MGVRGGRLEALLRPRLCPRRQPCLQYWPEPGRQQYGLMEVEFVSGTADEDLVARVFRVQNVSRVSDRGAPGENWGDGMVRDDLQVTGGLVTGAHVPSLAAHPQTPAAGGAPAGAALPVPALVCVPGHT